MICPDCKSCFFHLKPPYVYKPQKTYCRIMKEPSKNEHCGMYIPANPERRDKDAKER